MMPPKRKQAVMNAVTEDHVRFVMTLEARNKLPEAFKACITQVKATRDTLEVLEGKWEALSALLLMSGAHYQTRDTWITGDGSGKFETEPARLFLADKREVDPSILLTWLKA